MTDDELRAEHERLRAQTEQLLREHEALPDDGDNPEHVEHRLKLQNKIAELRAHMERLKARKE